jgi:hypothetical protein
MASRGETDLPAPTQAAATNESVMASLVGSRRALYDALTELSRRWLSSISGLSPRVTAPTIPIVCHSARTAFAS